LIKSLSISNYALIDNLFLNLNEGFTCLTGETGTGKSIILGAISLILGERADTKVLFDTEKKCIVEAVFSMPNKFQISLFQENNIDYFDECIIRREITAQGKSRIFVNDSPVALNVLKAIGAQLIDLHSQYQKFSLSDNLQQLLFLDNFITDKSIIDDYSNTFKSYSDMCHKKAHLQSKYEQMSKEQDYYSFLYNELNEANIIVDEDVSLEKELLILDNSELIKEKLSIVINCLTDDNTGNIIDLLNVIRSNFSSISTLINTGGELSERIDNIAVEAKDISGELSHILDTIFVDYNKVEELRNRQEFINKLLYKHKAKSANDLIAIRDDLQMKLSNSEDIYTEIESLTKKIDILFMEIQQKAQILSNSRKQCAETMAKQVSNILKDIGISNNKFVINVAENENYTSTGNNTVEFLFSANTGSPVAPLWSVASGGELSRVMLALKSVIAMKNDIPTVVFDEIDSGISGNTAATVAAKLQEIAQNIQVIAISHLPQIAAKADTQFLVYKEEHENRTFTRVKQLNPEERINAIASMLSGSDISDAALENAKILLTK